MRNKRGARQREKVSDMELARRLRVTEEQETEIEALQAIFAGLVNVDCDDVDVDHDFPRAFSITVVPHPAVPESNHSFVELVVRLSREYPVVVPHLIFRSSKGLSKSELDNLMDRICVQATRLLNEPMIYEIVTLIQEELRLHNQPETSLHEEMVQKQKQESEIIAETEKQREAQKVRLQQESNDKLAKIKATETLTSEAEQELRMQWLQSKSPICPPDPLAPEKLTETLHTVQMLLAHLLNVHFNDSGLSALVESGLIPSSIASLSASELSANIAEVSSKLHLWLPKVSPKSSLPSIEKQASALPSETHASRSRYQTDFIEMQSLGQGSFGRVTKVQNRLDGLYYAMKIINMRMRTEGDFRRILREVTALSRLSHPYVLRYYQAFIECVSDEAIVGQLYTKNGSGNEWDGKFEDVTRGSLDWSLSLHSDSLYLDGGPFQLEMSEQPNGLAPKQKNTYELFIQTEFCAQTLRETILSEARQIDPDQNWRRFRQILEGLAHIHSQGICHRDLKPGNIFVHPCGDVRIGDLGLATHFQITESIQTLNSPSLSPNEDGRLIDHTTAIGTMLYIAPEMLQTGSGNQRYDSKVDMYSLAIVLFEMWYPFHTAHERVAVLQNLRNRSGPIFPDGFQDAHPRQSQIIVWLLQLDPERRPSALELLQSNLLPPKLEDEYMKDALRTISNPNTPFYHRLLSELFNSQRPMPTDSAPVASEPSPLAAANPYLVAASRHCVISSVRAMFESHSGLERSGQLIQRPDASVTTDCRILLMDREGRLLDLRHDLRSDLEVQSESARYFQIGTVFRSAGAGRPIPKHITQADFDIVGSGAKSHYADAEIVSLLISLMDMFPILGEPRVYIGHVTLTSSILDMCNVPQNIRPAFLEFVKETQSGSGNRVDLFRQFLSRYQAQINVGLLISILSLKSNASEGIAQLRNYFIHKRNVLAALDELQAILAASLLFGVSLDRVEIAPLLSVSPGHYSGFVAKSFVISKGSRTCLTVGGRYDYVGPDLAARHGVGLSLAIEQLWEMVASYESQERRPGKTVATHCTDVFVASVGSDEVFEERLKIVGELYSTGINVGFLSSRSATLEEQQEMAAVRNAQWLLTIKDKYVQNSVKIRQLDSDKKQELDLARDEIVKFFAGSKHISSRRR
uniref:non-specific serine/threonine protein kinase n=1 Tax=Spongospora subterranea TaxID=70186 RepID=A0A0H5RA77_9EUKA|eukprot:CRZ10988.1 hypothetical protein [Spongospora subterranea]